MDIPLIDSVHVHMDVMYYLPMAAILRHSATLSTALTSTRLCDYVLSN